MTILELNGFYPYTRDEYIIKGGIHIKRIIRDIFFILDKQIYLIRWFVTGFLYKTNATFSINTY